MRPMPITTSSLYQLPDAPPPPKLPPPPLKPPLLPELPPLDHEPPEPPDQPPVPRRPGPADANPSLISTNSDASTPAIPAASSEPTRNQAIRAVSPPAV